MRVDEGESEASHAKTRKKRARGAGPRHVVVSDEATAHASHPSRHTCSSFLTFTSDKRWWTQDGTKAEKVGDVHCQARMASI